MTRKTDVWGQIVKGIDRSIKESIKESERQQRLYEKECIRREKEQIKRDKLHAKKNALQKAFNINWKMKNANLSLISLNNNYEINSDIVSAIDSIENIDIVLDELKYGHRVKAIEELLVLNKFSYNLVIDIIRVLERNLLTYLKRTNNYYDENEISSYEFASQGEIFEIDGDVDYYSSRAEVLIYCNPLEIEEIVTSKEPNVLNNKIIKSLTKLNDKYINELYKFHESRENSIIQKLHEEYDNILKYNNENHFVYENLFDKREFESELEFVEKPQKKEIRSSKILEKELTFIENNKTSKENITIPLFYQILSYTPLKCFTDNYIRKEYGKLERLRTNCIKSKKRLIKEIQQDNIIEQNQYEEQLRRYNIYLNQLEEEKNIFFEKQNKYNKQIQERINKFTNGEKDEIEEYFLNNLLLSPYPILSYKDIELDYNTDNKLLIINYVLPNITDICNIKKVSLIVSKKEFKTISLKQNELNDIYNNILYKICLRTVSEIFENDKEYDFVENVVFNGIIKHFDDITGQERLTCIMTLQVNRGLIENYRIPKIDAKNCFKSLKGIAAPELASLIPVRPLLVIDKDDSRFVEAYDVVEQIDEGYNLATMHWKDFENLVRELFEKEFCTQGSEVKITQSSHDGGVDAIIFDPDPIRGGKIIVQAKRYTNIVGVSNVRDLYGTVLNEGAIKGILVTTSNYGADSYEFAKNKPLTLLNGSHLLHLLAKQGKKAIIDLKKAKEILKNNE